MIIGGLGYGQPILQGFVSEPSFYFRYSAVRCRKDLNGKRGNLMTEYIINENSTAVVGLWFKDENEKNVVPGEIIWRVDDANLMAISGVSAGEIIGDTTEIPTSYKHNIYIPGAANIIIDDNNMWEERLVTIRYTYGDNGVGTEEMRFKVKNLIRIPSVPVNPHHWDFIIDGGGA